MNTIKQVLAACKAAGFKVSRSGSTVNGLAAYTVVGEVGLFSKNGLCDLIGWFD